MADGTGAISCTATLAGLGALGGSSYISCSATLSGIGVSGNISSGSVSASATLSGTGLFGNISSGSVSASAAISGIGILAKVSSSFISGIATLTGTYARRIYTGLSDIKVNFFEFGNKLYIQNGEKYLVYDGSTCKEVEGYRPKVAITTPPAGGGTLFEQINVLTGAKHQTFSPDGTATVYQLAETAITSVDFVKINDVLKTVGTDYTVNLTDGKVTFTTPPLGGTPNNVDIGWTKGTGQRSLIENCRFAMSYSGQTDTRVFFWGNRNFKNRRFWSGLADGVPSAEYFEANSYDDLGSGQYAITDIKHQYSTQKIYLENSTMYSYYASETDSLGNVMATFPVFDLNDSVGNVAENQVQLINNNPLTIYKGIREWYLSAKYSNTYTETNERIISQRIQGDLDGIDLTTVITYDWQEKKEYWLCLPTTGIVWVYNYLNDTWYKFDNIYASCFLVINKEMYFGTGGKIEKFEGSLRNDNGVAISDIWEMGLYDFNASWRLKFMNKAWISINPDRRTSVDVKYITNNEGTSETQTVYYNLLSFAHLDFKHFSFNISYNPQPFDLEVQAQQFVYIKFVLTNSNPETVLTVLNLSMLPRFGGKVQ